jgi:hypothetical protein
MWRLQGGSYIPGFSGQAFGAGLQRDVTKTRKDQSKKAAELQKYMSKRGTMGEWGGKIGAGLLGVGLGAMGMGPLGLTLGKTLGAGLGSALGSSEMLSGKGPSMKPGVDTGLLGSTYEQLGEAKGGIGEAMKGQAMGAGAAQLASGLTGMAGDKLGAQLGDMFGKWKAGRTGLSGYEGKGLGNVLGLDAPGAGGIPSPAGGKLGPGWGGFGMNPAGGAGGLYSPAGEAVSSAAGGAGSMAVPDLSHLTQNIPSDVGSQLGTGAANDMWSGGVDWYEPTGDEPFFNQQGGYIPQYQIGGALGKSFGLSKPSLNTGSRLSDAGKFISEYSPSEISNVEDIEQSDAPMVDMDRILAMSKIRESLSPEEKEKVDLGYSSIVPPRPRSYGDRVQERNQNLRDEFGTEWYKNGQYDSQQLLDMIPKYQMGGMMPGGVSNALPYQQGGSISPYNLGGSVTQQPMAYQLGGLLKYRRSPMMG